MSENTENCYGQFPHVFRTGLLKTLVNFIHWLG